MIRIILQRLIIPLVIIWIKLQNLLTHNIYDLDYITDVDNPLIYYLDNIAEVTYSQYL